MKLEDYIYNLLFDDQPLMEISTADYYNNKIIEELKFCKITQKSVDEISLHEFEVRFKNYKGVYQKGFVLSVRVIYNGVFEHQFDIYRKGE